MHPTPYAARIRKLRTCLREASRFEDAMRLFMGDLAVDASFVASNLDHHDARIEQALLAIASKALGPNASDVRMGAVRLLRDAESRFVHGTASFVASTAGGNALRIAIVVFFEDDDVGLCELIDPLDRDAQILSARFTLVSTPGATTTARGGTA